MTQRRLSDWTNGGQGAHDALFDGAKTEALNKINAIYSDDLDSATPDLIQNYTAQKPITLSVTFEAADQTLTNSDPGMFNFGELDAVDSLAGEFLGRFGFNTKGKATGAVKVKVKNLFLGKTMPVFYTDKMLFQDDFTIENTQSLVVDVWDLKKGDAVIEDKNYSCDSDYCKQLSRMVWGSLMQDFDLSSLGDLLGGAGIHWPFTAMIASKPLDGSDDSSISLNVARVHTPLCKHYTNVFKDTNTASRSEYYKTYDRLGNNYMGCPEELKQEYDGTSSDAHCQYDSQGRTYSGASGCP
jgi:hypothetical protein